MMVPTRCALIFLPAIIAVLLDESPFAAAADGVDDESSLPPPCSSSIYCYGDLLHTVQMAEVFSDSKTFVDMKMKNPANETMERFREFMSKNNNTPTAAEVENFVHETFDPAGSEFEDWDPTDWVTHPKFVNDIMDPVLQKWALDLHDIWKLLGRKMKDDVRINEDLYSIIYVPNPVIVPGGRFREFYYWDSFWIVEGLLHSEMYTTVKGMLSNFVSIVDKIGFIPNGGRVYYNMRSQPPMLSPMVKAYLDVTDDTEWLVENLWLLEKEFDFWMSNHTVTVDKDGDSYTLARYYETSSGPRPESYREDYINAQIFHTDTEKNSFYRELKTAAESGWDFSSRWFILDGTNKGNLTNLKATQIIPVDLNAILYWNAVLLSEFNAKLGNATNALKYAQIAEKWQKAVTAVLWHEEVGAWLDYDMSNEMKRDYFYPTNIAPLWTNCYDVANRENHVAKVLKYLEKSQIMINFGGIPTTLEHSGEQWDYPNAWPPLQYIMIMALNNTGDSWAQRLAFEIAQRWIRSNYRAFNDSGHMYEKYDATVFGVGGGGGEYEVQLGFGWSNGVVMELLHRYADKLTAEDIFTDEDYVHSGTLIQQPVVSTTGQLLTGILVLVISLATGFIGMVLYRSRHYYAPGPSTMSDKRRIAAGGGTSVYRKRVAYTELKDMNYD